MMSTILKECVLCWMLLKGDLHCILTNVVNKNNSSCKNMFHFILKGNCSLNSSFLLSVFKIHQVSHPHSFMLHTSVSLER